MTRTELAVSSNHPMAWRPSAAVVVRILPVSEKYAEYGRRVEERLRAKGFRVAGDYRPEKVGYKIRDAQLEKIPYMLVVGEKEQTAGTVAVRDRVDGDLGAMTLSDLLSRLENTMRTVDAQGVRIKQVQEEQARLRIDAQRRLDLEEARLKNNEQFELIVIDYSLPANGAFIAASEVSKINFPEHVPVILFNADETEKIPESEKKLVRREIIGGSSRSAQFNGLSCLRKALIYVSCGASYET